MPRKVRPAYITRKLAAGARCVLKNPVRGDVSFTSGRLVFKNNAKIFGAVFIGTSSGATSLAGTLLGSANGVAANATQITISGLATTPTYVWIQPANGTTPWTETHATNLSTRYVGGWLAKVTSRSGTTLTLTDPVLQNYTGKTFRVYDVSAVASTAKVDGLARICAPSSSGAGLGIYHVYGGTLRVRVSGAQNQGIFIDRCSNLTLSGSVSNVGVVSGNKYGLEVKNSYKFNGSIHASHVNLGGSLSAGSYQSNLTVVGLSISSILVDTHGGIHCGSSITGIVDVLEPAGYTGTKRIDVGNESWRVPSLSVTVNGRGLELIKFNGLQNGTVVEDTDCKLFTLSGNSSDSETTFGVNTQEVAITGCTGTRGSAIVKIDQTNGNVPTALSLVGNTFTTTGTSGIVRFILNGSDSSIGMTGETYSISGGSGVITVDSLSSGTLALNADGVATTGAYSLPFFYNPDDVMLITEDKFLSVTKNGSSISDSTTTSL